MEHKKGKQMRPPTPRQRKSAKLMAENLLSDKPKSQRAILKEAGYTDNRAKQPARVTRSDGFQQALAEYLPADFLLDNHNDIIRQRDHIPSAVKALDLAYEIKGMKTEKGGGSYAQFLQVINVQAGKDNDPVSRVSNNSTSSGSSVPEDVIDAEYTSTEATKPNR